MPSKSFTVIVLGLLLTVLALLAETKQVDSPLSALHMTLEDEHFEKGAPMQEFSSKTGKVQLLYCVCEESSSENVAGKPVHYRVVIPEGFTFDF